MHRHYSDRLWDERLRNWTMHGHRDARHDDPALFSFEKNLLGPCDEHARGKSANTCKRRVDLWVYILAKAECGEP